MLGTRDNRREHPYRIDYVRREPGGWRNGRVLSDSARTLESARERIERRLTKPHNRHEVGRIFLRGKLIREIHRNSAGGFTTSMELADL